MRAVLVSFVVGIIFAIGLGVSGMTQPQKVIGFLDITGNWDGSLMFVMLGAIGVHLVFFRWIVRQKQPIFSDKFSIPTRRDIDLRLVSGSAIFGIGWGMVGICPGPGLVSLASGVPTSALFVASMVVGMYGFRLVHRLYSKRFVASELTSPSINSAVTAQTQAAQYFANK